MAVSLHAWLDKSEAPFYRFTYAAKSTDEELREAHETIHAVYRAARGPLVWVVDCQAIVHAPATQRQIVADHERVTQPYAVKYNVGTALIITNTWVRGLLTAVQWVSPSKYPLEVFAARAPADLWARARLARALARVSLGPPRPVI